MVRVGYVRDEELEFEAVVLEGDADMFEIQRSLAFDEQDRSLGEDTYCLVVGGGPAFYGGVESWEVAGHDLRLTLSEDAVSALGLAGAELVIPVGESGADVIRAHLGRLLAGW